MTELEQLKAQNARLRDEVLSYVIRLNVHDKQYLHDLLAPTIELLLRCDRQLHDLWQSNQPLNLALREEASRLQAFTERKE